MQSLASDPVMPVDPGLRAAEECALTLREFGGNESSPVLELLSGIDQFELDRKYPAQPLSFANDHWRTYYHSHVSPVSVNGEHGHFHFFSRIATSGNKAEDWAHVAGLSFDSHGQPLMWFTVNRWVTGDAWLPADELYGQLQFALLPQTDGLLSRWAMSILCLYREELRELLQLRDRKIKSLQTKNAHGDILQSKAVYELSSTPVNLLEKLSMFLV